MKKYIEEKEDLERLEKLMFNELGSDITLLNDHQFIEDLQIVGGCINDNLGLDEIDYENASETLKKCWKQVVR